MNSSQLYGILRIVIPSAAAFAIGKGWITSDLYTEIGTALATIVAAGGFSANANTTLNLSKAVAATQGVQVHVDASAPVELQAAAADRTVKDIVPATGTPTPASPYATQRK